MKTVKTKKLTQIEKDAHEYHLQQARELLKSLGYVQGPGDTWTRPDQVEKHFGRAGVYGNDQPLRRAKPKLQRGSAESAR
jgi:hypothetical protein